MSAATGLDLDELRESVREVLADACELRSVHQWAQSPQPVDRALWARLAELGWFGLSIDEGHGGMGLGFRESAVLCEEFGRALAPLPALPTVLAAQVLALYGDHAQQSRWLPGIAAGESIATLALDAEPVTIVGDTVSGQWRHVPFADAADLMLLPVTDSGGRRMLAVVTPQDPGVHVQRESAVDLTRSLCRVQLDTTPIDAGRLLPVGDDAALQRRAAALLAADAVGGAAHILERTVAYLSTRVQFGRPIGSFQALKHRAADWKVRLEAAQALARNAAAAIDGGDAAADFAATSAKVVACDTYAALAGDAVQLHGGIGFTWEHECHLFLKRALLNQALFGASNLHRDRIARDLLTETSP